jgi:oligopeptide/dipeptide ABC transporter ATP-binding protein
MRPLLDVKNLRTHFFTAGGVVKAVDGVTFSLSRGETLGLVGESGCGKTMTAMSILRLVHFPGKIVSGEIWFFNPKNGNGLGKPVDLLKATKTVIRRIRGAEIAMIFQEPMAALNPVFTIGNQITEALRAHEKISKREAENRTIEIMQAVSIPLPDRRMKEYPHQLSGGLRQRAMIAMALVTRPKLLIADEPTTALDVTIQAQILDLLVRLKEQFQLSLLIISHDLGVIAEIADSVAIMYAGKIVEEGPTTEMFENPLHPYTEALLRAVPKLDFSGERQNRLEPIPGSVHDLSLLPVGCTFQPRCKYEMGLRCSEAEPPMIEVRPNHRVRCVKYA